MRAIARIRKARKRLGPRPARCRWNDHEPGSARQLGRRLTARTNAAVPGGATSTGSRGIPKRLASLASSSVELPSSQDP